MRKRLLAITTLLATLPFAAQARPSADKPPPTPAEVLKGALALPGLTAPNNLAAGALAIGPDDVKPITTTGALGSTLLSGIGADGSLKGAFGVSFSPFTLGASVDIDRYERNALARLVARTNFSAALSQAETSAGNGTVAIGVQTVLFDRGDILLRKAKSGKPALKQCASNAITGIPDRPPPPPGSGETESDGNVPDTILLPYISCVAALNKATWNDSALGIGIVSVSRATGNKVTDLNQSNTVAYLSFSYGFEGLDNADELSVNGAKITSKCGTGFHLSCNAQLVVKFKYESDAAYDLPGIGATSAETYGVGVKLMAGNERTVTYAYYRQEEAKFASGDRDLHEWGLGIETKIGEKTWINLVAGRKDDDIRGNENTVKATFSWDVADAASLLNPFAK